MRFPASGVQVFPLVPFAAALLISTLTSVGGVSGAFVLLPFQVSVLGFASPAVTPTNHLFNVLAIPSGVYRYIKEGRMLWPLAAVILVGTLPGVIAGSLARIYLLPDPRHFKLFMGIVLLFIGLRLLVRVIRGAAASRSKGQAQGGSSAPGAGPPASTGPLQVQVTRFDLTCLEYTYAGGTHRVSSLALGLLTAVVGVVGGAYGVGGGAIIAPILVSFFDLPIHTIAGATLSGTCATSLLGVLFFVLARPLLGIKGVSPDWLLGGLMGAGGMLGMYIGARLQRFVPARAIEALLGLAVTGLAGSYVVGFFS